LGFVTTGDLAQPKTNYNMLLHKLNITFASAVAAFCARRRRHTGAGRLSALRNRGVFVGM
jgi:hypothetical protein